jgi:hypothetical protein
MAMEVFSQPGEEDADQEGEEVVMALRDLIQ